MSFDLMRHALSPGHSPCIGHCTHDAAGLCLSCRRHEDEVKSWRDLDRSVRGDVWARLPAQIDDCGRGIMRLPLDADDITALAADTLARGGRWSAGLPAAGIMPTAMKVGLSQSNTDGATITLDFSGKVRAVVWARNGRASMTGLTGCRSCW